MIEAFYQMLSDLGYAHPIHPFLTHIVIGLVVGAFLFSLASLIWKGHHLTLTARHCLVLAFIMIFPTILLGYMDWQHFYSRAWTLPIKMKIILAAVLFFLLLIALLTAKRKDGRVKWIRLLSLLCFLPVMGLGYFGGELVYGGRTTEAIPEGADLQTAAEQFSKTCAQCHPNGGNVLKPSFPLKEAPQLKDFETFLEYVRSPKARDGSPTMMPPFPAAQLSGEQMEGIYRYITEVLQEEQP